MPNPLLEPTLGRGGCCSNLDKTLSIHLRCHDVRNPAVCQAADAAKRGVGSAAAPNRRPAALVRRRQHGYFMKLKESAGVGGARATPQLPQHVDALGKPRAPLGDRHAAGLVLLRKFATDADSENETAFRQMVEGRYLLGHRRRVAQRQEEDGRAELQPAAHDCGLRKLQQRVKDGEGK